MEKLRRMEKYTCFAGAAKAAPKKSSPGRKASPKTVFTNKIFSLIEGMVSLASGAEHLYISIPKLMSVLQDNEFEYKRIDRKNHWNSYKLRPNFRFARDHWSSSVNYGSAGGWYY